MEDTSGLRDVAVQMVQAMQRTPANVAAEWASIVAHLCAGQGRAAVLATSPPSGE